MAITAHEARYASYGYASYPGQVMEYRAKNVCKFLGHRSATFAKAGDYGWDDLLEVNRDGYATVVNASYASYATMAPFEKVNCK